MTPTAVVVGAAVWLGIAVSAVAWLAVVIFARGALPGPKSVARWLLASWLPRLAVLAAWGAAGWHVFCQRP